MENVLLDLGELCRLYQLDQLSGRARGEAYCSTAHVMPYLREGRNFTVRIGAPVAAINDTFIKGMFSRVFGALKTRAAVAARFTVEGDDHYVRLFDKNWQILEALGIEN